MTDDANGEAPRADARQKLADELQRLRVRSGKSLRELAACTHSSDSSLSRYLTGQVVPPWRTVETLCGVAGEDPGTVKALWSQARSVRILDQLQNQEAGHRSAGGPSPPGPPPAAVPAEVAASARPGSSRHRSIRTAAAVLGVLTLMALTGVVVRQLTVTSMEDRFARERTAAAATESLDVPGSPRCQFSHSRIGKALWMEAFIIDAGGTLKRGEVCHIGRAHVTVDEENGLTVRNIGRRDVEWQSSWFTRKGTRTDRAVFTVDGRLSTYDATNTELWASHRPTRAVEAQLAIQSDGNLVIYSKDWQHLWAIR
jgi:transcriptional regulator with XRE-family HTH domain